MCLVISIIIIILYYILHVLTLMARKLYCQLEKATTHGNIILFIIFIFGRFHYDKSTKPLYNIHTIEIKDIRCIHQGRENGMAAILLRWMF